MNDYYLISTVSGLVVSFPMLVLGPTAWANTFARKSCRHEQPNRRDVPSVAQTSSHLQILSEMDVMAIASSADW